MLAAGVRSFYVVEDRLRVRNGRWGTKETIVWWDHGGGCGPSVKGDNFHSLILRNSETRPMWLLLALVCAGTVQWERGGRLRSVSCSWNIFLSSEPFIIS
ncbi:hypothetical protein GWI33_004283 [Rhynchophorus ferrugineus]|uniref:Uncharacterized protein n=1 Tax=Rhynchophorus ferrugineus TaxID=354439 RepID=A0A834IQB5_RHYFE|nr:hypothetical protein GWI33_004283 [Rhynchophorus ferrugineus]